MKILRTTAIPIRRIFSFYLVMVIFFWIEFEQRGTSTVYSLPESQYLDYLILSYTKYLWGAPVQIPGNSSFYFPIEWLSFLAILCMLAAIFPTNRRNGFVAQISTRLRSHRDQWLTIVLWCTLSALFFFTAMWCGIIIGNSRYLNQELILLQSLDVDIIEIFIHFVLFPLLAAVGVLAFQMAVSLATNKALGLIASLIYLSMATISDSPLFLGNMLMTSRSLLGTSAYAELFVPLASALAWASTWFFVGFIIIKKRELL